jgi:hypothetical protein
MASAIKSVVVKGLTTVGMSSAFACWWYRPAVDRRNGQGTRRSGSMSAIDYHDVSTHLLSIVPNLSSALPVIF